MLFDVQSALAEILSEPMEGCDSCDSRDTTPLKSQESRKSQRAQANVLSQVVTQQLTRDDRAASEDGATRATCATPTPPTLPHVAQVARVARSTAPEPQTEAPPPCDTCDTCDTEGVKSQKSQKSQPTPAQFEGTSQRTRLAVVSQKSRVSQPPHADIPASGHAKRATDAKAYLHGTTSSSRPVTWTGKVVSLAQWRELSDWERHGPQGRVWDGQADQWVET